MKPKRIFVIISISLLAIILYLGLPIANSFYKAIFDDPLGSMKIMDKLRELPSETLINKLHSTHPFAMTPAYAMQVLAERRETKAVPELIKFIKSWHPDNRYQAIRALGNIGDVRAIEPLFKIVEKGDIKSNPNYRAALYSLCQIDYEPVRPIILDMLKRPDGARNGAVSLMKYIGKKEDIPLLEEMYNKVHEKDDTVERIEKGSIKRTIEAIKQKEGMK